MSGSEEDLAAAELALRLLDGDELRAARVRENADPAFASAVSGWDEALMPLLDDLAPVEPHGRVWTRIAASLALLTPDNTVVALRGKLRFWRAAAALTAMAAALALAIGMRAARNVPSAAAPAEAGELLIAAIKPADASAMAVASYDRRGQTLLVTPVALSVAAGRSCELWVVPASGPPRSLGLIAPGATRRIALADDLARLFAGKATLAISDEPEGGSRTGSPTGPVLATGTLGRV